MKEIAFKTTAHNIEVKASEDGKTLHIKGYACAFSNIDCYGDIIAPTACTKYLADAEAVKRTKLCYQHNRSEVIGVITSMVPDNYGLLFEADIIDTKTGEDVQKLIKAGAINEFSIGYIADEWHEEKRPEEGYIRVLDAITIAEISPVTRAANPKAILLDAKSEEMTEGLRGMRDEDLERLNNAVTDEYVRRVLAKV